MNINDIMLFKQEVERLFSPDVLEMIPAGKPSTIHASCAVELNGRMYRMGELGEDTIESCSLVVDILNS